MADDFTTNLAPFAYEGVEFPGDDVSTGFGHDSAKHQGYGMRGADIETTGPKPKVIRVRAVMRNGLRGWTGPALFPTQYQRLVRALDGTPEGYLTHATRGVMRVHFDEGTEELKGSQRDGVVLQLVFTEQQGDSELLDMTAADADPEAAMVDAAAQADAQAPPGIAPITPDVDAARTTLDAVGDSYLEATAALDALAVAVQGVLDSLDAPSRRAAELHGYRASLRRLLAATLARRQLVARRIRELVVPAEMSLARVSLLAFGDPRRGAELARVNALADPSRVPAGTRIRIVE